MTDKAKEWWTFVQQCLFQRIPEDQFYNLSKLLIARNSLPGSNVVQIVLKSRSSFTHYEPLVPKYLVKLYLLGHAGLPEILTTLLKQSLVFEASEASFTKAESSLRPMEKWKIDDSLASDFNVIQEVTLAFNQDRPSNSGSDISRSLLVLSKWISAILSRTEKDQASEIGDATLTASVFAGPLFEAIGILLVALLENERVTKFIISHQEVKSKLGQTLSSFIPFISQISITVGTKLDSFQKQYDIFDHSTSNGLGDNLLHGVDGTGMHFEDNVIDGPLVNSRAGLYVYLNAMLVGRPLVNDSNFMTYIGTRYAGEHALIAVELITAAFDVVSHAMYHHESAQTAFVFRSFLVQKLPILLSFVSASSLGTLPTEYCITQALSRLDPNAFPSFSQTFDTMRGGNIQLSDVRQEFLFACALHRLIPEGSIVRLLGEDPMASLPTQLVKQDLMEQINTSSDRAEQLIDDLESMNGNAGVIVDAVIEVMHSLCANKETITLKNICSFLARKPQIFDVMLLFRSPSNILQPLCTLLDEWRWDDDIGEYQPVYDEFGSILLLILAFKYRYGLDQMELGIENHHSFLSQLFERHAISQPLEILTEQQSHHLGAWITALFIADEGIGDELMSSCSPQEFYLLVPTLFNQSLGACDTGKLDLDRLKGGFEYLLEPFLLPSLVIALTWLSKSIWETNGNLSTSLQVLQALIKPGSISGEAQATHHFILSITARPLEQSLREARRQDPTRKPDIDTLLEILKPHLSFQRTASTLHKELQSWTSTHGGGLLTSIRNVFQSLVFWSSTADISMTPPSYTHRQTIAAIQLFGAPRVLQALLDELKLQNETGSGDIALDVVATLICAPSNASLRPASKSSPLTGALNSTTRLTLHDALLLEYSSLPQTSPPDPALATQIIRLHRRCQALLAPPASVMLPEHGPNQPEQVVENMMQDISNMDDAAASLTANDAAAINLAATDANEGVKMDMGDIDSMLDAANAAAGDGSGMEGMGVEMGAHGHVEIGADGLGEGLGDGLDDLDLMDVGGADFNFDDLLRG